MKRNPDYRLIDNRITLLLHIFFTILFILSILRVFYTGFYILKLT